MDVARSAYETERKKQSGETVIVGVNKFVDEARQDEEIVLTKIDPNLARKQIERLHRVNPRENTRGVARGSEGV